MPCRIRSFARGSISLLSASDSIFSFPLRRVESAGRDDAVDYAEILENPGVSRMASVESCSAPSRSPLSRRTLPRWMNAKAWTIGRTRQLTTTPLPQANAHAMIRRRAAGAGIKTQVGNHTFRATGITAYLKNGGTFENAAAMANHASTRTTQLYDRRRDEVNHGSARPALLVGKHSHPGKEDDQ
jgi:hypothetical protein